MLSAVVNRDQIVFLQQTVERATRKLRRTRSEADITLMALQQVFEILPLEAGDVLFAQPEETTIVLSWLLAGCGYNLVREDTKLDLVT